MAHACACHSPTPPPAPASPGEETVGALLERFPASLPVLQRFGVNHCCGAQISLAEAAAAAGVALDTLLVALRDVR